MDDRGGDDLHRIAGPTDSNREREPRRGGEERRGGGL